MCWPESPSRVQLFATPWTVAHQALLSMGFSRQEYWSGLPCPPPRDLPNPGNEPEPLMSPTLATSAIWSITPLKRYVHPENVNVTLFGLKVFLDIIKLRILRCHSHSNPPDPGRTAFSPSYFRKPETVFYTHS